MTHDFHLSVWTHGTVGNISIWKTLVNNFCVDQLEYILSLFTLMLTIQFVLYSLHKCYVSPKGQVLFLIKPCISVLHKKLLFK